MVVVVVLCGRDGGGVNVMEGVGSLGVVVEWWSVVDAIGVGLRMCMQRGTVLEHEQHASRLVLGYVSAAAAEQSSCLAACQWGLHLARGLPCIRDAGLGSG